MSYLRKSRNICFSARFRCSFPSPDDSAAEAIGGQTSVPGALVPIFLLSLFRKCDVNHSEAVPGPVGERHRVCRRIERSAPKISRLAHGVDLEYHVVRVCKSKHPVPDEILDVELCEVYLREIRVDIVVPVDLNYVSDLDRNLRSLDIEDV